MVLLEQKIKIIQWREKLDMQMRAGFEFTNMCRVKSKSRRLFISFPHRSLLERGKLADNGAKIRFLMNMLIPARKHGFLTFFSGCLLVFLNGLKANGRHEGIRSELRGRHSMQDFILI